MKSIKNYILEAFKINKNTKLQKYNYFPKDKSELIDIIVEHFENNIYDLNDIDTSKIIDMSNLFSCKQISKYQYETNYFELIDVSRWDVSNVENMKEIFYRCDNFNCDISRWDVSNVTNLNFAFYGCYKFNQDLSKWDVSNVIDLSTTFSFCFEFEGRGLKYWNTSNVKTLNGTFVMNNSLKEDISNWDVSNVNIMTYTFNEIDEILFDIGKWDVSNVNDFSGMFYESNLTFKHCDISKWDMSGAKNIQRMFSKCNNIDKKYFNLDNWNIKSNVDMFEAFKGSNIRKKPKWYKK